MFKVLDHIVAAAGLTLAAYYAATIAVADTHFHNLSVSDCRQNQYLENLHEVIQGDSFLLETKPEICIIIFFFCYKTAFFCSYCFLIEGDDTFCIIISEINFGPQMAVLLKFNFISSTTVLIFS